ncbi:hypothetical protein M9H77_30308 [Catharanthus roseus]|uniref:Uncharacterized protein n=1 Tax=Catharanthus roseus TaxID=4058 RepID=A0ACB9ZXS5_CATRO|nr:hypothetical protein M9H77_30308 [Catharanthus roseus]
MISFPPRIALSLRLFPSPFFFISSNNHAMAAVVSTLERVSQNFIGLLGSKQVLIRLEFEEDLYGYRSKIYEATASLNRPSIAHICVEIDLLQPLPTHVWNGILSGKGSCYTRLQTERPGRLWHLHCSCRFSENPALSCSKESLSTIGILSESDILPQQQRSGPCLDSELQQQTSGQQFGQQFQSSAAISLICVISFCKWRIENSMVKHESMTTTFAEMVTHQMLGKCKDFVYFFKFLTRLFFYDFKVEAYARNVQEAKKNYWNSFFLHTLCAVRNTHPRHKDTRQIISHFPRKIDIVKLLVQSEQLPPLLSRHTLDYPKIFPPQHHRHRLLSAPPSITYLPVRPLAIVNGDGLQGIGLDPQEEVAAVSWEAAGEPPGVGEPDEPVSSSEHVDSADQGTADCWSRGTTDVGPCVWGLLKFLEGVVGSCSRPRELGSLLKGAAAAVFGSMLGARPIVVDLLDYL